MEPIDLVTPPASPQHVSEVVATSPTLRTTNHALTSVKTESDVTKNDVEILDDGDVEMYEQTNKRLCIAHQSDEGDDNELIFVGHKGNVATLSLPHFRSMCGFHKFPANCNQNEAEAACPFCYCFICDRCVNECNEWNTHCFAVHTDKSWQEERQRVKATQSAPLETLSDVDIMKGLICVRTLVSTVALKTDLHICQKQTLAWAQNLEAQGIEGGLELRWPPTRVGPLRQVAAVLSRF